MCYEAEDRKTVKQKERSSETSTRQIWCNPVLIMQALKQDHRNRLKLKHRPRRMWSSLSRIEAAPKSAINRPHSIFFHSRSANYSSYTIAILVECINLFRFILFPFHHDLHSIEDKSLTFSATKWDVGLLKLGRCGIGVVVDFTLKIRYRYVDGLRRNQ